MAWLPAGPTASEAAQIILLLVLVLILRLFSSVCVFAVCLLGLLFILRPLSSNLRLRANTDTLVKDRLRILCDRNTRGKVPPVLHTTGPRLHHDCAALLRACTPAIGTDDRPLLGMVAFRQEVTSARKSRFARGMQPQSCGMQTKLNIS